MAEKPDNFEARDFVPISGYCNFADRNYESLNGDTFRESLRESIMDVYHIGVPSLAIIFALDGLIKLLP